MVGMSVSQSNKSLMKGEPIIAQDKPLLITFHNLSLYKN